MGGKGNSGKVGKVMNELIEKYEREIERLDSDMRDGHDNGFRAGKLAALVMVVADLKSMQDKGIKPWCEEIAEKEVKP